MTPLDIINNWTARVISSKDYYSTIADTIKFVVKGTNGGSWIFDFRNDVKVIESQDEAGCTITIQQDDLLKMYQDKQNPQELFVQDKIKVSGKVDLAFYVSEIIEERL